MKTLAAAWRAIRFWWLWPKCPWCPWRGSNLEAHFHTAHAGAQDWKRRP